MAVFGLLSLLLLFGPGRAGAQQTELKLDLGLDAAFPGERASPNVVLSFPGEPALTSMHFELAFPSRMLSFVAIVRGEAAEAAGAELKSRVLTSPQAPDESVLVVDVGAATPIGQGTLLKLSFDVSKTAPADQRITYKARNVLARSAGGTPLEIEVIDGAIAVLASTPAVIGCFFYMH